jgi:hypothetical protein
MPIFLEDHCHIKHWMIVLSQYTSKEMRLKISQTKHNSTQSTNWKSLNSRKQLHRTKDTSETKMMIFIQSSTTKENKSIV